MNETTLSNPTPLSEPITILTAQMPIGWEIAYATQTGRRHRQEKLPCQDSIDVISTPDQIRCGLADGVSGGAMGEVCSLVGVKFCTNQRMRFAPKAIDLFNRGKRERLHLLDQLEGAIIDAVAQHTDRIGATTLTAAWVFRDGQAWITRIGDCRAYQFSQDCLRRIAEDQTYANMPQLHCPLHVPTNNPARMVGNGSMGTPEFFAVQLEVGDSLILCSDGLHGFVGDHDIAELCRYLDGRDLVQQLMDAALQAGGDDDIAILVLKRKNNTR